MMLKNTLSLALFRAQSRYLFYLLRSRRGSYFELYHHLKGQHFHLKDKLKEKEDDLLTLALYQLY